ncbi:hypothetical protein [Isoptericola rhizosphaerae]|uniref:hypothetical protein n=1 Tax=Isoptericola rhizosphaerae TaxID=3377837 RepID=UPI00383A6E45
MMTKTTAILASYTVTAADDEGGFNPFDGVTPDITVFGVKFENTITLILGGLWALCLVGGAIGMLLGGGKWALATKVTHSVEGALEGSEGFKKAAIATGVIALIGMIFGAIMFITSGGGGE